MMSRYILILIQLAIMMPGIAFCQIETTPKPKPVDSKSTKQQPTGKKFILKVTANLLCQIFIDGEPKGVTGPDKYLKISFEEGTYNLKAVSTVNDKDSYSVTFKIISEMMNTNDIKNIDLVAIQNNRISHELKLQKAEDDKSKAEKEFSDFINQFEMVLVKGGTFQMGNDSSPHPEEKPVHPVTLSDYYIGKYEVTQKQWKEIMGNNPSLFIGDNCPVERVRWNEIQEFIQKLNIRTEKRFRLPTEAEWEYAARGGIKSLGYKYAGSDNFNEVALMSIHEKMDTTYTVGSKSPNELGIYDMTGNVLEYCSDLWDGSHNYEYSYYYSHSAKNNPQGLSKREQEYIGAVGGGHIIRGGDMNKYIDFFPLTRRQPGIHDGMGHVGVGFRLALSK